MTFVVQQLKNRECKILEGRYSPFLSLIRTNVRLGPGAACIQKTLEFFTDKSQSLCYNKVKIKERRKEVMKGKELLESIDFLQNLEINGDDEIEIKLDVSAKGINVDFYVDDIFLRTLITLKLN